MHRCEQQSSTKQLNCPLTNNVCASYCIPNIQRKFCLNMLTTSLPILLRSTIARFPCLMNGSVDNKGCWSRFCCIGEEMCILTQCPETKRTCYFAALCRLSVRNEWVTSWLNSLTKVLQWMSSVACSRWFQTSILDMASYDVWVEVR